MTNDWRDLHDRPSSARQVAYASIQFASANRIPPCPSTNGRDLRCKASVRCRKPFQDSCLLTSRSWPQSRCSASESSSRKKAPSLSRCACDIRLVRNACAPDNSGAAGMGTPTHQFRRSSWIMKLAQGSSYQPQAQLRRLAYLPRRRVLAAKIVTVWDARNTWPSCREASRRMSWPTCCWRC